MKTQAYKDGYNVGYTWLKRGDNFLHYNERNGYIPGGPSYYELDCMYRRDCIKSWQQGWIDGIDQFCKDHNLIF